MWKVELEKEILKEIISDWDSFLFSNEIYWQLHISNKKFMPSERRARISSGRLLISSFILHNRSFLDNDSILNQFLALKNKWLANWQKKISEELPIRVRQWNQFINDLRSDSEFSQPQMNSQLQIRLMIDLLIDELDELQKEQHFQQIAIPDQKYKYATLENSFIWESEFIDVFPPNKYWYLYRKFVQPGEKK
ncbi:MAG: hypothetical protein CVU41_05735 [Chloroflexi bacterium HGW-Chloroflexi-3]|nr:MAG: hypothetical protein CVU41_05735 [Chloroflexi bacterium HGW-Chloroflexi-3]